MPQDPAEGAGLVFKAKTRDTDHRAGSDLGSLDAELIPLGPHEPSILDCQPPLQQHAVVVTVAADGSPHERHLCGE